eukprot:1187011-Prorocentrum_minimum.AAC.3
MSASISSRRAWQPIGGSGEADKPVAGLLEDPSDQSEGRTSTRGPIGPIGGQDQCSRTNRTNWRAGPVLEDPSDQSEGRTSVRGPIGPIGGQDQCSRTNRTNRRAGPVLEDPSDQSEGRTSARGPIGPIGGQDQCSRTNRTNLRAGPGRNPQDTRPVETVRGRDLKGGEGVRNGERTIPRRNKAKRIRNSTLSTEADPEHHRLRIFPMCDQLDDNDQEYECQTGYDTKTGPAKRLKRVS